MDFYFEPIIKEFCASTTVSKWMICFKNEAYWSFRSISSIASSRLKIAFSLSFRTRSWFFTRSSICSRNVSFWSIIICWFSCKAFSSAFFEFNVLLWDSNFFFDSVTSNKKQIATLRFQCEIFILKMAFLRDNYQKDIELVFFFSKIG